MATSQAAARPDLVRQQDEFIELICADSDLLRTEFEAIVAAGWSGTPLAARGDVRQHRGRPAGRHPVAQRQERLPDGSDDPGAGSRSRQRSPPPDRPDCAIPIT
jgi:hypothetical protein